LCFQLRRSRSDNSSVRPAYSDSHFSACLSSELSQPLEPDQPLIRIQTATQAQSNKYCDVVVDAFSLCELSTAGFDDLEPTQQASCLCGPSLATIPWGPSSFDSYMNGCYSYKATASPAVASSFSGLQNFCASNYAARIKTSSTAVSTITPGPIRSSTTRSAIIASISTATTSSPVPTKSNTADYPRASTFSVSLSLRP
jgi:hypothetical protein